MLTKSCVLHCEIEFVHPFSDGTGRMGRLWQTLALMRASPVFAYLYIEALVRESQNGYYKALAAADQRADADPFITFMLGLIEEGLADLLASQRPALGARERIIHFRETWRDAQFGRKDYLVVFPELSTATASRDLRDAVAKGDIERTGDGRTTMCRITWPYTER